MPIRTTEFLLKDTAAESDQILANIGGKTSKISLANIFGNTVFSAAGGAIKDVINTLVQKTESGAIPVVLEKGSASIHYFGKMVSVNIRNIPAKRDTYGWCALFTIPEEFRPQTVMEGLAYDNGVSSNEKNFPLQMRISEGVVCVYLFSDKLNISAVCGNFSYIRK